MKKTNVRQRITQLIFQHSLLREPPFEVKPMPPRNDLMAMLAWKEEHKHMLQ